ncbi:MAG TPA: tRNA (adenosine(37)-N6)-threonylcarbamoyltransferase complex dimerization subunit type 1 TsaB [Gammaproteobacteria bacterium]|nr:tRNA (adenosine(37)-N6)-threonylcarbamoyltransferase complex dimerization subunit type 1 TsaB [Gammaproteobacteria bacterium]
MKLLAFDTSTEACSAALFLDGSVTELFEITPRQQSRRILTMIEQLLSVADVHLSQLDAVAFTNGPGSFTGIRLAASVAQGLALGADLPVIPVSTLTAMAQGAYRDFQAKNVLVAMDGHSGEIYWGVYKWHEQSMHSVISEQRCNPAEVPIPEKCDYLGVGNGWEIYAEVLNQRIPGIKSIKTLHPQAIDVAKLAEIAFSRGCFVLPEAVVPYYLHQADTWKKLSNPKDI